MKIENKVIEIFKCAMLSIIAIFLIRLCSVLSAGNFYVKVDIDKINDTIMIKQNMRVLDVHGGDYPIPVEIKQ